MHTPVTGRYQLHSVTFSAPDAVQSFSMLIDAVKRYQPTTNLHQACVARLQNGSVVIRCCYQSKNSHTKMKSSVFLPELIVLICCSALVAVCKYIFHVSRYCSQKCRGELCYWRCGRLADVFGPRAHFLVYS